jgi:hypothetical protein
VSDSSGNPRGPRRPFTFHLTTETQRHGEELRRQVSRCQGELNVRVRPTAKSACLPSPCLRVSVVKANAMNATTLVVTAAAAIGVAGLAIGAAAAVGAIVAYLRTDDALNSESTSSESPDARGGETKDKPAG